LTDVARLRDRLTQQRFGGGAATARFGQREIEHDGRGTAAREMAHEACERGVIERSRLRVAHHDDEAATRRRGAPPARVRPGVEGGDAGEVQPERDEHAGDADDGGGLEAERAGHRDV